jgi:hypothetical protein
MPAALNVRNSKTYRAPHNDMMMALPYVISAVRVSVRISRWVGGWVANLAFNIHSATAYHGMLGAGQITILDSCLQGLLACGVQRSQKMG